MLPAVLAFWCGWACAGAAPEDTIRQRVVACSGCHGDEGRATSDGYYPRIAGKPAGYLYRQLLNFRYGVRHNPVMQRMLEYLPDDYLKEIAQYYSEQHPPYVATSEVDVDSALLQRGKALALNGDHGRNLPACIACHGRLLMGAQPDIPGLLGLPRDYLAEQLGAWSNGSRSMVAPDCMEQIAKRLGERDTTAVTAWLASQPVDSAQAPEDESLQKRALRCGAVP